VPACGWPGPDPPGALCRPGAAPYQECPVAVGGSPGGSTVDQTSQAERDRAANLKLKGACLSSKCTASGRKRVYPIRLTGRGTILLAREAWFGQQPASLGREWRGPRTQREPTDL